MTLTFQQAEDVIFASYMRVGAQLKGFDQTTRDLSGMQQFYTRAGIHLDFAPAITVTGSKGKGSTTLLASALLHGAGRRVGTLTSPHFLSVRERIRFAGRSIPESDFIRIVSELAPDIEAVDQELPQGKYLSPTGLFMAVALRYFEENHANALVLEVGRGGRYDDVSLYQNQVACFTPIMEEHLDKMGPRVADIAWHKAGILKPNTVAVSAPQIPEAAAILHQQIVATRSRLLAVGEDVSYEVTRSGDQQRVLITLNGQVLSLFLNTPAIYQGLNLAVACGAATQIIDLKEREVAPAIAGLRLPGRCDLIAVQPTVYVDGAINRESAAQFRASVESRLAHPLVLVTALPHDKDHRGFFAELAPLADRIFITQVSAGHLHFDTSPLQTARQYLTNVTDEPNVFRAFQLALDAAGSTGELWVVGTQSLVRDAMRFWGQDLDALFSA